MVCNAYHIHIIVTWWSAAVLAACNHYLLRALNNPCYDSALRKNNAADALRTDNKGRYTRCDKLFTVMASG